MIIMEEDLLLTLEEAAKILRVTTTTTRRYIKQRDLQGVRVGGRWRVRRSAVDRYLDKNTREDNK